VDLPEGSFFGELQILMNIKSAYEYSAQADPNSVDINTWCMTIQASKFKTISAVNPNFQSFILTRGL